MLLAGLAVLAILALGILIVPVAFAENSRISPVFGAGVSGCQDRNGCFNPMITTIEAGDDITFWNSDYVAHTLTSGTPDVGPDGIFDTGLVLSTGIVHIQIDTVGEIPYFCIIHPWMTGLIIVEGDQPEQEQSEQEPEIPPMPKGDQADLYTIIEQLVELVDDLKEQVASLEERIEALEAGNSEPEPTPEPEPEQPETPETGIPETPESTGPDVFITTDKREYGLADTIKVTGFIDRDILDAQFIDDSFGTPVTRYNVGKIFIQIDTYQQGFWHICERPKQTVGESNLDPDTFVVYGSTADPSLRGMECFDESGNFGFDFTIEPYYPSGMYAAHVRIFHNEGSGITEYSERFTVG